MEHHEEEVWESSESQVIADAFHKRSLLIFADALRRLFANSRTTSRGIVARIMHTCLKSTEYVAGNGDDYLTQPS